MFFQKIVFFLAENLWSLPFLILIFFISIFMTIYLNFVQIKYFFKSIKYVFSSSKDSLEISKNGGLNSFQAFMNTLSTNTGNGTLVGIPVAVYYAGPGAIFWLILISLLTMALRYSEVFLGSFYKGKDNKVGPMIYLGMLPGGRFLPAIFALGCLFYMLICGNMIQANSFGAAFQNVLKINPIIIAFINFAIIFYVLIGNVKRIVVFLDKIVPIKVFSFFISALIILVYYYKNIPNALLLIFSSAFGYKQFAGGIIGYSIQKAIGAGFQRGIFINESGIGTAAVNFGTGENEEPVKNGIISILSMYISTFIISLMVSLIILSSGQWQSGLIGADMIVAIYESVFGSFGKWIVTFIILNFAISLIMSCSFTANVCWNYLSNKRFKFLFIIIYSLFTFVGTIMGSKLAWALGDIICSILFFLNVFGLIFFAKTIRENLLKFKD